MRGLFAGFGPNAALHDPSAHAAQQFAVSLHDLPAGEQLALLTLRRSEISRAVVEKLRKSTARASQTDYWALVRARLATRHMKGFLYLTPHGRRAADAIAQEAARALGLHFFTTGHDRLRNFVRCSCGWSHHFTAPLQRVEVCNAQWMHRHLLQALAGDDDGFEDFKNVYGDEADSVVDGEFEERTP